jgi:hypothetical protein
MFAVMPQLKVLFKKEKQTLPDARGKTRIFIGCFCVIGEICVYPAFY